MALMYATAMDGGHTSLAPLKSAFSQHSAARPNNAQTTADANSSSENTNLSILDHMPGTTSLKQRVTNLMEQGNIYKAAELIETALESASDIERAYIMDLAYDTLATIKEIYPEAQGLINDLSQTLENYGSNALSGIDFSGNDSPVFGAINIQESPNTGDVAKVMSQETIQATLIGIGNGTTPWRVQELKPPTAFAA